MLLGTLDATQKFPNTTSPASPALALHFIQTTQPMAWLTGSKDLVVSGDEEISHSGLGAYTSSFENVVPILHALRQWFLDFNYIQISWTAY